MFRIRDNITLSLEKLWNYEFHRGENTIYYLPECVLNLCWKANGKNVSSEICLVATAFYYNSKYLFSKKILNQQFLLQHISFLACFLFPTSHALLMNAFVRNFTIETCFIHVFVFPLYGSALNSNTLQEVEKLEYSNKNPITWNFYNLFWPNYVFFRLLEKRMHDAQCLWELKSF